MGNCCGSEPKEPPPVYEHKKKEQYKLPKIIVIPEDSAFIYLDITPSPQSDQVKKSLKRKFPNLIVSDSNKRITNQIEWMKERKCYIVVGGNIREQTLKSLLSSSKVRGIYFPGEHIDIGPYSKSPKFKGFYPSLMEMKNAIYNDVRSDEIY